MSNNHNVSEYDGRRNIRLAPAIAFTFAGINLGIYAFFITCFLIEPFNQFVDYWTFVRYIAYSSFLISLIAAFRFFSIKKEQQINLILFYIALSAINLLIVLADYALHINWTESGWLH